MSIVPVAKQNYGEVFTRRWVVEILLDLVGYTPDRDLAALRLLEPSCGSGAFLGPAVERLIASSKTHGHDLALLADSICAYDLQAEHVAASRKLCRQLLTEAGAGEETVAALVEQWVLQADFLCADVADQPIDVAVGNPPYIRYDDLPETLAAEYRRTWPTMRGRGDIYIGFIERCLRMLRPGGRLGLICADRWMRNQYGAALRELVAERYAIEHVWTMHDVDAFEAEVSAYPAIIVFANHPQDSVVAADTTAAFGESSARALAKWSEDKSLIEFSDIGVKAHRLPRWFSGNEFWPTGNPARLALIERLNEHFPPLEDAATGTKVSIGVATGADKVYVTHEPQLVEPDRMLPLARRQDLRSGSFEWTGAYLVNPWNDDGSLVSLADYPRLAAYLSQYPLLRDRHVARRSPDRWYRTIDKVHSDLTSRPKLLFEDMKTYIHPVLEPGGHYPAHGLYYVVSDTWDMEVLGGVLLSRIAQAFIEAYCVRMRGGTLRFQAQYLKRIRVPDPARLSQDVAENLRVAFRRRDIDGATKAASAAYGIDPRDYDLSGPCTAAERAS